MHPATHLHPPPTHRPTQVHPVNNDFRKHILYSEFVRKNHGRVRAAPHDTAAMASPACSARCGRAVSATTRPRFCPNPSSPPAPTSPQPSTGFNSLLLILHVCAKVRVFGFATAEDVQTAQKPGVEAISNWWVAWRTPTNPAYPGTQSHRPTHRNEAWAPPPRRLFERDGAVRVWLGLAQQ